MLKILYAASNNRGASLQLSRFMHAMRDSPHQIKVAAYLKSSPTHLNIDWTLDSLLNIYKPEHTSLENDNFRIYFDQVKYYSPDLVISDLEYFTSYAANLLDITLWQCSSSIINFALVDKYDLGLFKNYSYVFHRNPTQVQRMVNIIDNSNCNFVYSHLGDMLHPPKLKNNFEWIRPYHNIGKPYIPCRHNLMTALLQNDVKILNVMKAHSDCVIFSDFYQDSNSQMSFKDINNREEYACNLFNSNLFLCQGETNFLADAFYNKKHSVIIPNFKDPECLINSVLTKHFNLGTALYDEPYDLQSLMNMSVENQYNEKVCFLHERIDEL